MIRIDNLTYGYFRNKPILKGISMNMQPGHIYGLLGRNGVGKSTFLKVMTGALLGEGNYSIDEFDPRQRLPQLQQTFRMVPEQETLFPMTIMEYAKITQPFYPNFSFEVLDEALKLFEVPLDTTMDKMSLGQQKKAIISLAFACQTPYLFLDEPTNGMDIPSKAIFRRLCAANMDENKTIIISTHQVDDLENLIDAVIIMNNEGVLLNSLLEDVAKRFEFRPVEPGETPLYSEPTLRGEMGIFPNATGIEGVVDTKLLFTAVVLQKIK